jgi:phosphoribosylglycinamide formyltransferase 1
MKQLAILISDTGTGTNLQAIIDAIEQHTIQAKIAVVISDTADAKGVERAKKHSLNVEIVNKQTDMVKLLKKKYVVDLVCLCGWRQIVSDKFIKAFPNKILNLHPGVIPDTISGVVKNPDGSNGLWNKGKLTNAAIQNVLDSKATYSGSSIHFLTDEFDFGPVLGRTFEKVESGDTVDTLYKRLKKKENKLYVEVLQRLCIDEL